MLTSVVFDFGNVLIRWEVPLAFPTRTPDEIEKFLKEFDFHSFNLKQDAGRSQAEALKQVSADSPKWLPFVSDYFKNYALTLQVPEPGMETLIQDLKNADIEVYGLTNWAWETWPVAMSIPGFELLDGVVASHQVGACKPEPIIYETLIERFGIDPASSLFIDDRLDNCLGAAGFGFRTFQFSPGDGPSLRQHLHDLGVNIATHS